MIYLLFVFLHILIDRQTMSKVLKICAGPNRILFGTAHIFMTSIKLQKNLDQQAKNTPLSLLMNHLPKITTKKNAVQLSEI